MSRDVAHNLWVSHHPILGFAPDTTRPGPAVYPGNEALQSVLTSINGPNLFPPNVQALIAGHNHLFEMVSFVSPHPTQLVSGNGGTWADAPLPQPLPRGASVAPGAVIETIASSNRYGFMRSSNESPSRANSIDAMFASAGAASSVLSIFIPADTTVLYCRR